MPIEQRVDIFHVAVGRPEKPGGPQPLRGLSTTGIRFVWNDAGTEIVDMLPDNTAHDLKALADDPTWRTVVGDIAAGALADAEAARAQVADLQAKADALPGETARADELDGRLSQAIATANRRAEERDEARQLIDGLNAQVTQFRARIAELEQAQQDQTMAAVLERLARLEQAKAPEPAEPAQDAPAADAPG